MQAIWCCLHMVTAPVCLLLVRRLDAQLVVQVCVMIVSSWPVYPDLTALEDALARQHS